LRYLNGDFAAENSERLYYQAWEPDAAPRALVLLVHGLGEHGGRYLNLASHLVARGYGVYVHDLYGHGKSPGPRADVISFADRVADLKNFFEAVRLEHPAGRAFMIGHSMGAAIATEYALNHPEDLAGLVLSGIPFRLNGTESASLKRVVSVLARSWPRLGLNSVPTATLSREQSVVDAYNRDPLVFHGRVPARTLNHMITQWSRLSPALAELRLPLLILHGGLDQLCHPSGSVMLEEAAGAKDKKLKVYAGLYHEIFNEPECGKVYEDVSSWLAAH
jgi:acylglycerol lipase